MKRLGKPGGFSWARMAFYIVLVAVVVLSLTVFVVMRDDINGRTLERFLGFLRLDGKDQESDEIYFDAGMQNLFVLSGDRLSVLSPARLVVYGKDGREALSRSVGYESPALYAAGEKVIAFDRRNPGGVVVRQNEILLELSFPVLTAAGNDKGQYVLVTEESGYRAVARFYNEKDVATLDWRSTTYISAVALSPSGTRMAVAGPLQEGVTTSSRIVFLDSSKTEALGEVVLPDELALRISYPDNSHVCILTEMGVYFFTDDGAPLGQFRWEGERLLGTYPTDKALFLHVGKWADKRYGRLICLGYEGAFNGEIPLNEAPDAMDAKGRVCAVLENGWMTEFFLDNNTLKERAHWETDALGVLMKDENNMLLLTRDTAVWRKNP